MAGYDNYSKSNNALIAEAEGEMNATNFAKYLRNNYSFLKGCAAGDIKAANIQPSSWHHTSCKYNATNYYCIENCDERDLARLANAITARKACAKWLKDGRIIVDEWFDVVTEGEEWYSIKVQKRLSETDYFRLYQQFAGRFKLEDISSWASEETKTMYKDAGLLIFEEIEL
jgi:hypothetical protein